MDMKRYAMLAIGFAVGWFIFRSIAGAPPEEDLIRDSAHEFGSSTGG
jgi:hypothetical protein